LKIENITNISFFFDKRCLVSFLMFLAIHGFVISFSPFGRRTSFLSEAKNLYHLRFWGSFDNAAFSRPARHEHYPCYVRPFAVGINFVEPAFARSEIKVNLYLACLIAALSKPAAFVALLARDDKYAV